MKRTNFLLWLCVGALCLSSCRTRIGFGQDPVLSNMTLHITPVWSSDQRPGRLSLLLYTVDGALFNEYDLPLGGGDVVVPEALYKVILYNPDAQSINFARKDRFEHVFGQALVATKADFTHSLVTSPGTLYRGVCEVTPSSLNVEAPMELRSSDVILKIKLAPSARSNKVLSVSLRNIADAVSLSSGKAFHHSAATINYTSLVDLGQANEFFVYSGAVFGQCVKESCEHPSDHNVYVDIETESSTGVKEQLSVDVSEAIRLVQDSAVEVTVEVELAVKGMQLQAEVRNWSTGSAGGDVTKSIIKN